MAENDKWVSNRRTQGMWLQEKYGIPGHWEISELLWLCKNYTTELINIYLSWILRGWVFFIFQNVFIHLELWPCRNKTSEQIQWEI